MNKFPSWLTIVGSILLISVVGCGSTTPTPGPTQTPAQVTVVVTATTEPATETPAAPSLTPLPTVVATDTLQALAATPTKAPVTPKPAATKKPATPAASPTATSPPLTLQAPKLVGPIFDPNTGRKDEFRSPGSSLVFEWQAISKLGQGVCYEIRIDFVPMNGQPATGDAFLQCDPNETQKAQAQTVRFTLQSPNHTGTNYSGLLANPPTDEWVKWYVAVVADQGPDNVQGNPFDPISGARHRVLPLSPNSDTVQFILKSS